MKIPDVTIPSTFICQDDRVTAADQFANVHTMHFLRQNHNILIARRSKKSIMTAVFVGDNSSGPVVLTSIRPEFRQNGAVAFSTPILVSQHTRDIEVVVRACRSSALVLEPSLYVNVDRLMAMRDYAKGVKIDIDQATGTAKTYNATLTLPQTDGESNYYYGKRIFNFELGYSCKVDDGEAVVTTPALLSSHDYVQINSAAGGVNQAIVNNTQTSTPIRQISRLETVGADTRYYIRQRFQERPTWAGAGDNIEIRALQGIHLYAVSIYEVAVTDFFTETGPL